MSTAWHLLERGHEVTVVDRQPDAALETSFGNAAQISVSYCEPWANKDAPLKALKWMFRDDAPLLFRPQLPFGEGWQQWRWGLQFLAQCNDAAFERNVQQLVALGAYSHAALKDVVAATGINYNRLERGIAHYFTDQKTFDTAGEAAALMRKYGVARRVVSTAELLAIEPAFKSFAHRIVGGTYTASDESGDARVFTQALAQRCADRGRVSSTATTSSGSKKPAARSSPSPCARAPCGERMKTWSSSRPTKSSWPAAPTRRRCCAPWASTCPSIPARVTAPPSSCSSRNSRRFVSTIDDEVKCAMSRLGDHLRVAGTIEVGGYDLAGHAAGQGPLQDAGRAHRGSAAGRVRHRASRSRAARRSFWTGSAPRHAHQHPLHRQDQGGQAVGQRRARHAGLDAMARVRARPSPS